VLINEEIGNWRKIVIERVTRTQDAFGAIIETWATFATIYANIIPVSGRELYSSDRPNLRSSTRFYIYYRDDITEKDRILYDSNYYDITYMREIGYRESLEIVGEVAK